MEAGQGALGGQGACLLDPQEEVEEATSLLCRCLVEDLHQTISTQSISNTMSVASFHHDIYCINNNHSNTDQLVIGHSNCHSFAIR